MDADADVVGRLVGAGWRPYFGPSRNSAEVRGANEVLKVPTLRAAIRNRKSPAIGIGRRYFCEHICTRIFHDKGNFLRIDA